jgi:uncharacterized membrane protein YhaH (DUF805 family)
MSSTFGRLGQTAPLVRPANGRGAPPPAAPAGRGLPWLLFSYQGRCRRSHFWFGRYGAFACYLIALIALGAAFPQYGQPMHGDLDLALLNLAVALLKLGISVAVLWVVFAIAVKRCHDRNKTGWFALIMLVPLLNIWTLIELGFLDGEQGPNRYGPSPKGVDAAAVFS